MSHHPHSVEALIRHAFGLLLEIREHREADRLLALVNAFLKMLVHDKDTEAPPMVVSVRALRICKRQAGNGQ